MAKYIFLALYIILVFYISMKASKMWFDYEIKKVVKEECIIKSIKEKM